MLSVFQNIDMYILELIYRLTKNIFFDLIMPFITILGNKGLIWLLVCLVLLISKKYRKVAILSLLALLLTTVLGELVLKNILQRPRPFTTLTNFQLLIKEPSTFSFPSGHTASSFAAAEVIRMRIEYLRIPVIILAVLIAFSRLYLFVHYPSDVFVGALLGIFCARIVLKYGENSTLLK